MLTGSGHPTISYAGPMTALADPDTAASRQQWFRLVSGALVLYLAILAFMLLAPSASAPSGLVDVFARTGARLGLPAALVDPVRMEFVLNIAAFAPVTFLAAWLWTTPRWHEWMSWGFLASFGVEVFQAVFLDARSATHSDVVANTLGALVGYVALRALRGSLPPASRHPAGRRDQSA